MIDSIMRKSGMKALLYNIKKKSLMQETPCDLSSVQAWKDLERYSPDPATSCIDKKVLGDDYDLEIIIPAYNVEKYIEECLDSVLSQKTEYAYHVTCINDGSADSTREILCQYEGRENISIIHQDNKGFSGARNSGLRRANGKYIMFLDSDDFIPQGSIQKLLSSGFFNDADIVEGGVTQCDEKGRRRKESSHKEGRIDAFSTLTGYPVAKVFKKHLFSEISFPEHYWYEDSIIRQIIYPRAKNIFGIDYQVYCRRNNPTGITNTGVRKKKSIDSLYITMRLYEDRKSLGIITDQSYYEYILRMARLTYLRTKYQPDAIKKAVFIAFSDFVNREFATFHSELYSELEFALRNKKYKLYVAYCEK